MKTDFTTRLLRALGLCHVLLLLGACGAQEQEIDGCQEAPCTSDPLTPTPQAAGVNPGQPGARRTARFDLTVPIAGGSLRVTITGPSDNGSALSSVGAPHPLVVFSPGFNIPRSQYTSYADRLASHGIVAVLQTARAEANHTQYRDDTRKLLDWLITPTGSDAPRVKGLLDGARIGVAGHSLGGKISLLVAAQDARVKGVLAIDPVDGGAAPQAKDQLSMIRLPAGVPLGVLGETLSKSGGLMPCTPADRNYEVLYAAAPAPVFAIRFLKAAHTDFVDRPSSGCFACLFCTGGSGQARTRDLAVKYTAAYFLLALRRQSEVQTYLSGEEFAKDVAAGDVSRQAR